MIERIELDPDLEVDHVPARLHPEGEERGGREADPCADRDLAAETPRQLLVPATEGEPRPHACVPLPVEHREAGLAVEHLEVLGHGALEGVNVPSRARFLQRVGEIPSTRPVMEAAGLEVRRGKLRETQRDIGGRVDGRD
ncbi:hypothetical protein PG994_003432 [Apiospora phragmitis]|uniref:Uncharacterized protein n=1 Tax=Apiospora phragmitis TaxID=2905665 RepID=A0ABR1W180_9PEZI